MRDSISIILSHPQMGENIGSAARIMKNFSFHDLRIVNPRDGWPNDAALAMSAGGRDIIEGAKLFDSLEDAVADLNFIYGAAADRRDMNIDVISATSLSEDISYGQRVGFVFGRESSGLTNGELSICNKMVTIEASPDYSSLNLAQALCVLCYEIYSSGKEAQLDTPIKTEFATSQDIDSLCKVLIDAGQKVEFFKDAQGQSAEQKLRSIFKGARVMRKSEANLLHGLVKAIEKK